MGRQRRSRTEWQLLVAEFERSGLSADAFGRRYELVPSTLKWWRWRLRREGREACDGRERAMVAFVRVAVSEPVVPDDAHSDGARLELHDDLVVHFAAGCEAEYVAAVVASTSRRLESRGARC